MTVRQVHYTSCEDGLEGIQGFQISAMTPGTPRQLVELAVRASAYEPSPGLIGRLGHDDLTAFPIAFGYLPSGRGAALFQSRYAGADFTGRMGNYFAHALLLDDAERELGDALPIDLWHGPVWMDTRASGKDLPEVTALLPGHAATASSTRRFLDRPGATAHLERVLGATQRALATERDRLVLVVPDDEVAAQWIAALCRSLPRALGLRVSFVTYTARPEESAALVSCTTPDVRLPAYGDFTAIDLTAGVSPAQDGTRYAAALARLWERDEVAAALDLAAQVTPAVTAAELDVLAVLLELAFDLPVAVPPGESLLVDAVQFAVDRMPKRLPGHAWSRIADQVQDGGGPANPAAWSAALRTAWQQGEPVPATLFGTYFVAVLRGAERRLWLPTLSTADLTDVAENVVLPELAGPSSAALGEWLSEQPELLDALVRVLEQRLVDPQEACRLAATLPLAAAQLLTKKAGEQIRLLTDLVLARHGALDRVEVAVAATRRGSGEVRHLGAVLWPEDPTTDDCLRLLRHLPPEALVDSGLATRITARVLSLASYDRASAKEKQLVEALLDSPVAARLPQHKLAELEAARLVTHFHRSAPGPGSELAVLSGIETAAALQGEIGQRLLVSIASFVMRGDPKIHKGLFGAAVTEHGSVFLPSYQEAARTVLATAPARQVAAVVVAWFDATGPSTRDRLVNDTLATALRKRKRKHLDRIGSALRPMADALGVAAPKPNWARWWQSWRVRHERRGLLALLGLRKR
ncbi:GTPase-associated protein 1-related protein [Goodfellowiella coeruleoviolacea]|uniref:Uncharacterized protein n=1 Tax=Goodfellowiella coeruleoviolacea TaxID=334858 RepID=A0AAE3KM16_9PSEU|nr:GTPase-associated protein 1-related protein [Goodfellowiella coeruleoviolacea]MCP2167108.1 hypothetical protein [Goodfellowiella coeruleoviolacea]